MYNTLAKLPIVIYEEISVNGGDLTLLLQEGEIEKPEVLADLWQSLSVSFSEKSENSDSKKIFRLTKEIDSFRCKHKTIKVILECLKFDWNNELVAKLREWGYKIQQSTYFDDIERIDRESEGLLVKIESLKSMLPKSNTEPKTSLYDVLSSYSAILGIDFDFETLSCLKYLSMQKQVASKIKASETPPINNKKTKSRG